MDRRHFVRTVGVGAVGLAAGCAESTPDTPPAPDAGAAQADAGPADTGVEPVDAGASCRATGDDIQGPYYREGIPVRADLDRYDDDGEPLRLEGTVTDRACRTLAGAVVVIWHADPAGGYDMDSPERRYYGQVAADGQGRFAFTTLMPGRYLNGDTYRPAHLHVKVFVEGVERLTTQLYFEGDPYNATDPFFEADRSMPVRAGAAAYDLVV